MSLSLDPDGSENSRNLRASKWHCAVTYSLFGDFIKTIKSDPVVFDLAESKSGVLLLPPSTRDLRLLFPLLGNYMF